MELKKKVPEVRFKGFSGEWEERSFREISESFEYGLNAAATKYDGENKYIRITDINDESHSFDENDLTSPKADLKLAENYLLKPGDVLFARTGASVGKTYIYRKVDGRVYYAGFLIRARLKAEVNADFIFQSTLTERFSQFVRLTSQRSGQPGINAQEYSYYSTLVPENTEQSRIGTWFQHLDQLITLHQKKYNKLTNIKKAMLEKMFPKNGADLPEIRFEGFEGKWEEKRLGEVGNTFTGLSGKTKDDFGHGEGRFVTYMNVFLNAVSNRDMTEPIEIDVNQTKVLYGDVFFTTSSETPEEVGMSSVWLEQMDNVYLNSFCFGFRPSIKLDCLFFAYMLRSISFRRKISYLAQGISRYNISKTKVMEISIKLPIYKEQKKIGTYFQKLDHLITLQQTQIEKLQNIKKACLEKMFV